jgi:phytanoyl-CoA hydroxylase
MDTVDVRTRGEYETFQITVDQYRQFHEQGFLLARGLVPPADVQEMNDDMDLTLAGRSLSDGVLDTEGYGLKPGQREDWARGHMLHRLSPLHEHFLLHPRLLDGLAALIGPDVLALQSQLFFKKSGQPGQGYHQDAYYLATFPDTLCGAWVALSPATVENGCLWFAVGSQHEPVYPDPQGGGAALTANIADLGTIENPSHNDLAINTLSRIVKKYEGRLTPAEAEPGDALFFGGHIIHWSFGNRSERPRRSVVGHYCNARSLVLWNREPWEGDSANYLHILARGDTHLAYAQPKFGTPCAANAPRPGREAGSRMRSLSEE